GPMSERARQAPPRRPAAVSVHDDRHVQRGRRRLADGPRAALIGAGRVGHGAGPLRDATRPGAGRSYLHDLMLFGFQGLVHALDRLVGELLHVVLEPLVLVLADGAVLLGLLQIVHRLATEV